MYVGGYIITVCFTCKDSDSFSNFVNFSRNKDLLKTDDLHLGFQKLMTASIKCARPTGRMYSKFISPGVRYFKRCVGLLVNMRKMSIYEIFKKYQLGQTAQPTRNNSKKTPRLRGEVL